MSYKIIRMYRDENKSKRVIRTGLSLEEAQEHCNREETHKLNRDGSVVWFDGYTKE